MKKRLDIRIEEDLRDGVELLSRQNGQTLTAVVERYVRDGLARDNGELVEQQSLPEIRKAVREEVGKAIQELRGDLLVDLQKSVKRGDDRLAGLILKGVRYAGIGQRMIYSLIAKTSGAEFAARAYDDAKEKTGKDIARPADETQARPDRS
jgi:hypothetical protein